MTPQGEAAFYFVMLHAKYLYILGSVVILKILKDFIFKVN
jgi:hypothetical protein